MIALDTNILVHAHRADASLHDQAKEAVRSLAESPAPWAICYHSLIEFHAVVTRPRLWQAPSTPEQAIDQIQAWRESPSLRILLDSEDALDLVMRLAMESRVSGVMIHDARIVACCQSHGVTELWSVDRDFSRFPSIKTRNPLV
ncbi:MAG: type II toxin-antitoxin system VapC family toxin [Luteolibacter sp.]